MRRLKLAIYSACAVLVFSVTAFTLVKGKSAKVSPQGFAVVELFTSEGCSSCPPADALLSKVQKESEGKPVYILAYHVDYWNRLGWRDPYSSAAYSQRQSKYSSWMNSSSVYTPQVVVNGRKEFIGSEEGTLRNAIKAAEGSPATASITLDNLKLSGDQLSYHYEATNVGNNSSLVVALVQKSASTEVKAGENSGRMLSHVQIVRQLQNLPLTRSAGENSIKTPKGLGRKDLEVIAFLQNQTNGQITAAYKTALSGISL